MLYAQKSRMVFINITLLTSLLILGQNCTEKLVNRSAELTEEIDSSASLADLDNDGLLDRAEENLGTEVIEKDSDGDGLLDGAEVNTHQTNPLVADSDVGGLNDGFEIAQGTNPNDPSDDFKEGVDSDGDGLSNIDEQKLKLDPNIADSDGDGLSDGAEVNTFGTNPLDPDSDNGGVNDGDEVNRGSRPLNNPQDDLVIVLDSDEDGISNSDEVSLGTNPSIADSDGDGLSDGAEVNTFGTNPLDPDSDKGGVNDGDEVNRGTDPSKKEDDNQEGIDSDKDGLSDIKEKVLGTNPLVADSDGDGLLDGEEVLSHKTNPLLKDSDSGGEMDGSEVARGRDPLNAADDVTFSSLSIIFASTPLSSTSDTQAEFVFKTSSSDRVEKIQCAIDPYDLNDFRDCSENQKFVAEDMKVGLHSFVVRVTDVGGYLHLAEYQWVVVPKPPVNLCESKNAISKTIAVNFAKQTKTCAFGSGENLSKRNGYVRARTVQNYKLALPAGAKLCDMSLEVPAQRFRYDDFFILDLNQKVLAASHVKLINDAGGGLKIFDFTKVRGKKGFSSSTYCLGKEAGVACSVPSTDRYGTLKMNISANQMKKLVEVVKKDQTLKFSMSTMGDDDRSDCKHTGFRMNVKVKYAMPE